MPQITRSWKHAATDHLPLWLLKKSARGRIQAASPYVTSDRLFRKMGAKGAELFIDFRAKHFAAGASDLEVLEGLVARGVEVFHVESLHAKVVLVGSKHFSVGSQNLTFGGLNNLEASFVSGSDTPSGEVVRFFTILREKALRIDHQDILEMRTRVEVLLKEFQKLAADAEEIDDAVAEARREREQAAEEARLSASAELRRRAAAIRKSLTNANQLFENVDSSRRIKAKVRELTNTRGYRRWFSKSTKSLVPLDRSKYFYDLLWDSGELPKVLSRYVMINLDTGRLAYFRLAGGRISFFENSLIPGERFELRGRRYRVHINFEWNEELLRSRNLVARLVSEDHSWGEIGAAEFVFSGRKLALLGHSPAEPSDSKLGTLSQRTAKGILRSRELKAYICEQLTENFKYKKNLTGKNAARYLDSTEPFIYEISTVAFNGATIFSIRKC